jgi:uncharacterized protein with von Willebrand factor type A (vWA) domain
VTDLAALVAGFERTLRAHGVAAGQRRAAAFADVLTTMPPASGAGFYWRARTAMLPDIADLTAFDAAFARFFAPGRDGNELLEARAPAPPVQRESVLPEPSERPAGEAEVRDAPLQRVAASLTETLAERSFNTFSDAERQLMLKLIAGARVAIDYRRSRRRRRHRHGDRFDLRSTLRDAPRTAGELVRRRTTRRRERPRPLVFLLDVSGSMEPFARALIGYAHVVAAARPAVHAFAFATRLTDLTAGLRRGRIDDLAGEVAAAVPDFGGGTRIGAALRAFNDRYAQRGVARGGTVVMLSDGWERDDPELLAREMERLRRLTRRIVWINPQKRHRAYEPLAGGMAAALPYVDAFLSGHNLRALDAVAAAIAQGELFRDAAPSCGRSSAAGATRR